MINTSTPPTVPPTIPATAVSVGNAPVDIVLVLVGNASVPIDIVLVLINAVLDVVHIHVVNVEVYKTQPAKHDVGVVVMYMGGISVVDGMTVNVHVSTE